MANYELSNRIYELRTQKGLSQKELGAILGVSNKAVSKWETGTAIPKTETLIKLAEVFEISTDELINTACKEGTINTDKNIDYTIKNEISINKNEKSSKEIKRYFLKVSAVFDIIISLIATSVPVVTAFVISLTGMSLGSYNETVTWTLIWASIITTVGYNLLGKYLKQKSSLSGDFYKHRFLYYVVPNGAVALISTLATIVKYLGSEYVGYISYEISVVLNLLLSSVAVVLTIFIMSALMKNSVEQDTEKRKRLFKTLAIIVTISSLAGYVLEGFIDYESFGVYNGVTPMKDFLSLCCDIAIVWLVYLYKENNPKREKIIYTVLPLISIWAPAILYSFSRILRYI
jgi:transcriptional regulator with XRE-family HTH domain